jgi:hypothetical protein
MTPFAFSVLGGFIVAANLLHAADLFGKYGVSKERVLCTLAQFAALSAPVAIGVLWTADAGFSSGARSLVFTSAFLAAVKTARVTASSKVVCLEYVKEGYPGTSISFGHSAESAIQCQRDEGGVNVSVKPPPFYLTNKARSMIFLEVFLRWPAYVVSNQMFPMTRSFPNVW